MICKQDFNVGDEVIMQNDEVVYTVVFLNKGARNATLRNPQKNSYKFGVPFTDIRLAPRLTPLCDIKLCKFGRGDRVTLPEGVFGIYNVVDIEFAIPEGYMCKLESLSGDTGGWFPESGLTLYATKETLESLKGINEKPTLIKFNLPESPSMSAIAEARANYHDDPEVTMLGSMLPTKRHIDIQEALGILMEATRIQMEYITRNPDPKCTIELIAANRVLARIHEVTKK